MAMIDTLRKRARGVARGSTQARLARLEEDVAECRAINIRPKDDAARSGLARVGGRAG